MAATLATPLSLCDNRATNEEWIDALEGRMKTLTFGRVNFEGVAYSDDGRFLVSLNSKRYVRFWDLADGTQRFAFALPATPYDACCLSLHGDRLGVRFDLLDVSVAWQFVRGQMAAPPSTAYRIIELEKKNPHTFLEITPGGKKILGLEYYFRRPRVIEISLWDAQGKLLSRDLQDRPGPRLLALTPDGGTMVLGEIKCAWLLGSIKGAEIARLELTDTPQRSRFSPDGRLLAVAAGRTVWLWDVVTHEARARFPAFRKYAEGLAFSPDGRLLAAGSRDGEIRLWDTTTCRQVACYNWKVGAIHALAFSPDGMTAAAAGHRSAIVLWDVE